MKFLPVTVCVLAFVVCAWAASTVAPTTAGAGTSMSTAAGTDTTADPGTVTGTTQPAVNTTSGSSAVLPQLVALFAATFVAVFRF